MKALLISTPEGQKKVYALQVKGETWLHVDGKTWILEQRTKGKKKSAGHKKDHDGEILAPMPGKVIKIAAQVGQSVAAGDVIIVMEAMKMEYTLAAHGPGKVVSIACQEGQQVELNQQLAKVEA